MSFFARLAGLFRDPNRIPAHEFVERRRPMDAVIDVRTPAEFAQGHLAGAVNVEIGAPDFVEQVERVVRKRRKKGDLSIYLYCRSGARSGRGARMLRARGVEGVFNAGGIGQLGAAGAELKR